MRFAGGLLGGGMRKKMIRPTDGELEILRVLWSKGPSSVGEVHKVQHAAKGTAYNTTLKLMQIMLEKGLVTRAGERPQIFSASVPEEEVQEHLVWDLLQRAFGGS